MADEYAALRRNAVGGDLELTIDGKVYRITEPTADEGERLQLLVYGSPAFTAWQEDQEGRKLIGGTRAELAADGYGLAMIRHVQRTALLHFACFDEAVAQLNWNVGSLGGVEASLRKAMAELAEQMTPSPPATSAPTTPVAVP